MRSFARSAGLVWSRLLEVLLIALLLVQAIRLMWTVVTPVGPVGEWRGRHAEILPAAMRMALFRGFDAFYPASSSGPATQNVTSLALTLFGIRINEGSGMGSAIIAGSDGVQNSYAVGDEIVPGVMLKAVQFDHVVIDRNGAEETIFLDQSTSVEAVSADGDSADRQTEDPFSASEPSRPVPRNLSVEAIRSGIGFRARTSNRRITGIVVSRQGPGFDAAGFRPGDIITQINGRAIGSADDLPALQTALVPGARISLMVERGADILPIAILVQGK